MGATPFLADLIDTAAKEIDAGPAADVPLGHCADPAIAVKRAGEEIAVKVRWRG